MAFQTACPFCNAQVVKPTEEARPQCPRCGEAFVASYWHAATAAPHATNTPKATSRFAVWLAVLFLCGGGLLAITRPWESKPVVPAVEPATGPATTIPPAALAGLRHLPASTNIIIALQPAAMASYNPSPREALKAAGVPDSVLASFEKAGVPLQEIEQIVVGLTVVPEKPIPGLTAFVRLRKPIDEDAFLKALQAERKPVAGRAIYVTKFNTLLATPLDSKTWLFGFTDDDLTPKPFANLEHLPPSLRAALAERIDPATYAMVATADAKWGEAHFFLKADKALAARLAKGRSVVAGIAQTEDGPKLTLTIDTVSDAVAIETRELLRGKLGANATVIAEGTRVTATLAGDLAVLGTALNELARDLRK